MPRPSVRLVTFELDSVPGEWRVLQRPNPRGHRMFNHEIFAVSFGRMVELLREGASQEEQRAALGTVFALTSVASVTLRVYQGFLTVDDVGIPGELEYVAGLVERMQLHGVAEIAIAKDAETTELLALARGLAAEPGPGGATGIKRRLGKARSARVMVIPVAPEGDGGRRAPSVTQAFEAEAIEEAAGQPAAGSAAAARDATAQFIGMTSRMVQLPGAPAPSKSPARPPDWNAPLGALPAPPAPDAGGIPAPGVAAARMLAGTTPLGAALAQVVANPFGPEILQRLTALGKLIEHAIANDDIEAAVHSLAAVVAWEASAPEGSPRNAYRIMLHRTLPRETLRKLSRHVVDARLEAEVVSVVRRGEDAVEVLLDMLASAETMRERKAYVTVLRGIPEGYESVVHMLGDPRWFVVRNVAELMGEHRIAEAVPGLEQCLEHADGRVRRAAAVAMVKIGTPATVEPLRRLLKSGDPELRPFVAATIGGPGSRALAMPLVALAEEEEDPALLKEYYLALGRIGTPDAVTGLVRAAKPGGKLLGRKPTAPRLAAVEGLRVAGAKAAVSALESLADDADKAVREAARAALESLKAKP